MSVTRRLNSDDIFQLDPGSQIHVGAGATIKVDGTIELINSGELVLGNTCWEDLRFPATGINPPGGDADATRETTTGRLSFSASAVNIIAIQVQMPHGWKEGSTIQPHVHWSPTNTNTGNVKWQLQYKVANVNEAFPSEFTVLTQLDAGSGVADKHQISSFSGIDMTGKTFSCMILILLSRLGDDAQDTYNAACLLNEFDIHYEVRNLGTNEEYSN